MRALLLLMLVAGTLPMTFVRPIIGLLLWLGFSYMNIHRIAWGFATNFPWVMISAVVTLVAMVLHAEQRQALAMKPVIVLMTLLLFWTGVTTLVAVEPELAQAQWIKFFKIMLMAYVTVILVIDTQRLHWVLWAIVLSLGFWGFKGGLFTLLTGGSYHVWGPADSFFYDNNDFALVMCMNLPLVRYLAMHEPRKWLRYGLWVLMGLTVVSILGTYSRGGFLGLSATLCMLLLKSRRRAGLVIIVPLMAVGLVSFLPHQWFARMYSIEDYQQSGSATGRIESWKFATHVAIAHPLTGGGFRIWASDRMWNRYGPPGAGHRAIHSIFFQILGGHGFVGLGLYLAMGLAGWFGLGRIRRRSRDGPAPRWMGDLASMMQVSLVAYVSAGFFLPMAYFDLMYQLLALVAVLQIFAAKYVEKPSNEELTVETQPFLAAAQSGRGVNRHVRGSVPVGSRGMQNLPRW